MLGEVRKKCLRTPYGKVPDTSLRGFPPSLGKMMTKLGLHRGAWVWLKEHCSTRVPWARNDQLHCERVPGLVSFFYNLTGKEEIPDDYRMVCEHLQTLLFPPKKECMYSGFQENDDSSFDLIHSGHVQVK